MGAGKILLASAAACVMTLGSATDVASAAAGSWTKITSPGDATYRFHYVDGGANTFTVTGKASADLTAVDVVCIATYPYDSGSNVSQLATDVPVTAGSFSTVAHFQSLAPNCRLRAIPSGSGDSGYLASYAGPVLFIDGIERTRDASNTPYGYLAVAEGPNGLAQFNDAGDTGIYAIASADSAANAIGVVGNLANFALRYENVDPSGSPTASALRVDGHNAYLPSGVATLLIGRQGLSVTQPALRVSLSTAPNGDATVTEVAPLVRCSGDNTYPPTADSCPQLVPTGVTFRRVSHFFRGDHQVRVRDSYVDTDGVRHTVAAQYIAAVQPKPSGAPGYMFPGHGSTFRGSEPGQTLKAFGTGARSVLERSDMYASADDPTADTSAITWSRPPSEVLFDPSRSYVYGMDYTVRVPAHGTGYLGFAVSERLATADVKPLAKLAERDMMAAPKITSPKNGSTVHGTKTTVTGLLTLGANGLPNSVKVNGHAAKITVKNARSATFSATFTEALGKHLIKVVATDTGGNVRTATIRVTNTH